MSERPASQFLGTSPSEALEDRIDSAPSTPRRSSFTRFCMGAIIALLFAQGNGISAAGSNAVDLGVKVSASSVDIGVPAGCTSLLVEVRLPGKDKWLRWRTYKLSGKPSSISLTPPKGSLIADWRATGTISADKAKAFAKKQKFPQAFYQGIRNFPQSASTGYQQNTANSVSGISGNLTTVATGSVVTALNSTNSKVADSATPASIVEADIWKTDGNTVYFFNQLRGLQVLDITKPSSPKLTATLRMPAVGQDLYLLPEQTPGERLVVLLTRDYHSGESQTDIVVVKVKGNAAQEVSRTTVTGWLSDSRLLGNRLYTVTTDWSGIWLNYSVAQASGGSNTSLSEIVLNADGTQTLGTKHAISGQSSASLISAGSDWLAVSTSNWTRWNQSDITLFHLDETGASLVTSTPITTAGSIYDKFKVSVEAGTLSAVSVHYETDGNDWRWTPITTLENFNVSATNTGSKVASLEIMRGEQLYATRFTSGKLYAVTFRQTDPLWVIHLTDRTAPQIAGHVEVPGFSTYIEPLGDKGQFLFTIGWDSGKVAASLFDVSDITTPTLKSRVFMDESKWGYSEAVYDEKALKVLPEDGLALVPFTGNRWISPDTKTAGTEKEKSSFVRLVDISLANGGSLTLRGRLDHDFAPRRATLVNGILTSISQKELITANIDNRDKPSVLADVALAWPVNQVIQSGEYLLQISDGSSAVWSGEKAAIRVSKTTSDASIVNDVELGEGIVQEAVLRSSKLYVLRKNWNPNSGWFPYLRLADDKEPNTNSELDLDVYDASALPNLKLLGTAAVKLESTETNCNIGNLVWITDTLPAVITQNRAWSAWDGPIMVTSAVAKVDASAALSPTAFKTTASMIRPIVYDTKPQPAVVRAFDVSDPSKPAALTPVTIKAACSTVVTAAGAGDGLLVFGYGESPTPWKKANWPSNRETPLSYTHRLGVLDFTSLTAPALRTPITLPGRLFAIGDVSRAGFLAFTESLTNSTDSEPASRKVQVSLIDELQASQIASTSVGIDAVLTAEGRNLYVADNLTLSRFTLDDSATLTLSGTATTEWTPAELLVRGSSVLGVSGDKLLRVSWPGLKGIVETWQMRQWFQLSKLATGLDRTIYAPMGDYGVERYNSK